MSEAPDHAVHAGGFCKIFLYNAVPNIPTKLQFQFCLNKQKGTGHLFVVPPSVKISDTYYFIIHSKPEFLNFSLGIDFKESIPPAYVVWLAGTITIFLLGS
jgi:hypothetical protein